MNTIFIFNAEVQNTNKHTSIKHKYKIQVQNKSMKCKEERTQILSMRARKNVSGGGYLVL